MALLDKLALSAVTGTDVTLTADEARTIIAVFEKDAGPMQGLLVKGARDAWKRDAPPCPRCGKTDDAVPATNYGRPTGGWQYRCCNLTTWPK